MEVGEICSFSQQDMDALAASDIVRLTVQGMSLTPHQAADSIPELIEVRNWIGNVELKVLSIEDGIWTMEVVKAEEVPEA